MAGIAAANVRNNLKGAIFKVPSCTPFGRVACLSISSNEHEAKSREAERWD